VGLLVKLMAKHHSGSFSSNTKVNPKEQCKAFITRSGKKLGLSEEAKDVVDESESVGRKTERRDYGRKRKRMKN